MSELVGFASFACSAYYNQAGVPYAQLANAFKHSFCPGMQLLLGVITCLLRSTSFESTIVVHAQHCKAAGCVVLVHKHLTVEAQECCGCHGGGVRQLHTANLKRGG